MRNHPCDHLWVAGGLISDWICEHCGATEKRGGAMRFGVVNAQGERLADRYWDLERMAERAEREPDKIFFVATDPRWENVWAYVGVPGGYYVSDQDDDVRDYVEFLIEVRDGDIIWYQRQILHKHDLDLANVDLFSWILNEMVQMVDYHMEEGKVED